FFVRCPTGGLPTLSGAENYDFWRKNASLEVEYTPKDPTSSSAVPAGLATSRRSRLWSSAVRVGCFGSSASFSRRPLVSPWEVCFPKKRSDQKRPGQGQNYL